jgi:hypothetical protein
MGHREGWGRRRSTAPQPETCGASRTWRSIPCRRRQERCGWPAVPLVHASIPDMAPRVIVHRVRTPASRPGPRERRCTVCPTGSRAFCGRPSHTRGPLEQVGNCLRTTNSRQARTYNGRTQAEICPRRGPRGDRFPGCRRAHAVDNTAGRTMARGAPTGRWQASTYRDRPDRRAHTCGRHHTPCGGGPWACVHPHAPITCVRRQTLRRVGGGALRRPGRRHGGRPA